MPSVAQESPTMPSSKKRRRDDNHQIPLYASFMAEIMSSGTNDPIVSSHSAGNLPRGIFGDKTLDNSGFFQYHHSSPLAARKIIPIPTGKRQRTTVDIDVEAEGEPMQQSPSNTPPHRHHDQQQQRDRQAAKHTSQVEFDQKIRSPPRASSTSLMSRCHICSRKPNKKSDLDSFADCQGCGQRTCYVCIRECLGWGPNIQSTAGTAPEPLGQHPPEIPTASTTVPPSEEQGDASFTMLDADAAEEQHQPGHHHHHPPPTEAQGTGASRHEQGWARGGGHRQVVCSRCCVEKGADGDVVCLGCLPFVEG
jgi:hypothetical protein